MCLRPKDTHLTLPIPAIQGDPNAQALLITQSSAAATAELDQLWYY